MPLIIACSSNMRTPELDEELESCGFNMFIETPITNDNVNGLL